MLIDLDGFNKRALCHRRNFSDEPVKELHAHVRPGMPVRAKVLNVDEATGRIELGMKDSMFGDHDGERCHEQSASNTKGEEEEDHNNSMYDQQYTDAADDDLDAMLSETVGLDWDANTAPQNASNEVTEADSRDPKASADRSSRKRKRTDADQVSSALHQQEQSNSTIVDDANAYEREWAKAHESAEPQTAEDYEKLILASPNSSYLWIRYMAHQVSMGELDEARKVAERALETIRLTDEQERENVWVSYMNLESTYGDPPVEAVNSVFARAIERANPKRMHLALVGIHERAGRVDEAEEVLKKAEKRFGYSVKVWMRHVEHLLTVHAPESNNPSCSTFTVQQLLSKAFQSLPRRKHVKATFRAALLEFKRGSPERARTMFESLLRNYPKRMDIFSAYVDQEVKQGDTDRARSLLERGTAFSLPPKKMKIVFKKFLEFEKAHGSAEQIERVKALAHEYVERAM